MRCFEEVVYGRTVFALFSSQCVCFTNTDCKIQRLFNRKSLLRDSFSVQLKTVVRCVCARGVRVRALGSVCLMGEHRLKAHGHETHTRAHTHPHTNPDKHKIHRHTKHKIHMHT